jgi:type I restriction enzyme S subunit
MINKDWLITTLDNSIEQIIDYRGKTPKKTESGIPLITAKIVKEGFIQEPNEFIAKETYKEWMVRGFPKRGDVVLTMEGPLGEVAQITDANVALGQRLVLIRGKKGILDNTFLKYFFQSNTGQAKLKERETGTTVTGIKQAELRKVQIPLPPLPEQRAIAEVLSSLDDKIELNRRMNRTLEQLAQAIYKHMFVDNPEREGWEIKKLDALCSFDYGKGLKDSDRKPGKIPVMGSNGSVGWHSEALVKGPGIVVGRKGNPGTVTFVHTDFFPIDTTFYITPKEENDIYWLFFSLRSIGLPNLGSDSAVPGLNRNIAYMSEVRTPPIVLMKSFHEKVSPFFSMIYSNEKENSYLAELRDTLLPKLMSGQVRVHGGFSGN